MLTRVYLFLFIALFSVSTTSVVIRYVDSVPPLTLAFWRMFFASMFLWIYNHKSSKPTMSVKNQKRILFAGFFLGLHFAFFFIGVRNTSVANATLLANTGPIFTALFSWYTNQRPPAWVYGGLFFSVLGIVIIQGVEFGNNNSLANFISLLSGFCIAITYLFASKIRKNTKNVIYGRWVFLVAAFTIAPISFLFNQSLFEFEAQHIPWFFFLGLVPSIFGHNMLNYSIKYLTPTAIASVPLGEPVIASLLCMFLFSEHIPIGSLLGAPFVFMGIFLIIKNSKSE